MSPVGRRCRWRGALLQVCWCCSVLSLGAIRANFCSATYGKIKHEDETRHPCNRGTDGGAGCSRGRWLGRCRRPLDGWGNQPRRRRLPINGAYY